MTVMTILYEAVIRILSIGLKCKQFELTTNQEIKSSPWLQEMRGHTVKGYHLYTTLQLYYHRARWGDECSHQEQSRIQTIISLYARNFRGSLRTDIKFQEFSRSEIIENLSVGGTETEEQVPHCCYAHMSWDQEIIQWLLLGESSHKSLFIRITCM